MHTITEIENAINYWRAKYPSSQDAAALCKEARVLADVYATMIVERATTISAGALTQKQCDALHVATTAINGGLLTQGGLKC
ncbi:hypothetical protein WK78_03085 [Burkholderia cepacia]|uniref:DUF3717 domain-containing protein n=1 Tax=Burkholderia cepacia TaxID=292 RepID=UPI000755599F|nr:DUF3717 domain-containing protein [Burkholderia cepacia]KVV25092.1 hypothetical protein WK78_03085 [Burkholderia cepacia]